MCVGWRVGFLFSNWILCTFVEIQPCGASACVETQPGSGLRRLSCCIWKISTHTLFHARDVLWFFIYTGPGKIPWNIKRILTLAEQPLTFLLLSQWKTTRMGMNWSWGRWSVFPAPKSKHFSQIGHSWLWLSKTQNTVGVLVVGREKKQHRCCPNRIQKGCKSSFSTQKA